VRYSVETINGNVKLFRFLDGKNPAKKCAESYDE
jgi:hypothetical protein